MAEATQSVGGLFCLDGIAAGNMWCNMEKTGVDVYLTAPQKGWSAPACVGVVCLSARAEAKLEETTSSSFTLSLNKWLGIMTKYEAGGFGYHTTLPTDALVGFRDAIIETKRRVGFAAAMEKTKVLGAEIRNVLESRGFKNVAAEPWQSPTVVVSYAKDATMVGKFKSQGLMIAGGVPFKLEEPEGLFTWRIGLFGIDKLTAVDDVVAEFTAAIDGILKSE